MAKALEERRINIRVDEKLFDELDDKRHDYRTSFQAIGIGLLQAWLRHFPDNPRFAEALAEELLIADPKARVPDVLASGEPFTPSKAIAPSTEVREDTFTALRDALARVPESLRAELLEVLERTAALVARGLGSTTKEGLQRSAELRRIAAEQAAIEQHINRRLAAKKSPATSTTAAHGGAGGEESERDEPAGKKKAK